MKRKRKKKDFYGSLHKVLIHKKLVKEITKLEILI
jgi:hypothetical protein